MCAAVWTLLVLTSAALPGALAEDRYDIKVYPVPRVSGPIRVDGRLDEPSWRRAPVVSGFTLYNAPELVEVQTSFQVLYDLKFLYLGVTCDEPLMSKLTPIPQARDSHGVFHGEAIEIFVEPRHDHGTYYQFAFNAAGSIYDSRFTDPTWNADVVARTALEQDRWILEVAIPWKDLDVRPAAGAVMGFNVCRDRYLGSVRQWSNWSQTNANFHDPERFAHLVFSPWAHELAQLGDEFRKGGRLGPIVVYSSEGFAQSTYRGLAQEAVRKLETRVAELEQTGEQESDPAARAELGRRTAAYRSEIANLNRQIVEAQMDAAAWARLDLHVTQLLRELDRVIWGARLAALLSAI